MKILTRKKQKKILDAIIKSGVALVKDMEANVRTDNAVRASNYEIARIVGGTEFVDTYYWEIDNAIREKIAERFGKK